MIETPTNSRTESVSKEPAKRNAFDSLTTAILIFLVAIGLRFTGITFDSMWLDEGYQTMVDAVAVRPDDLEKLRPEPFIYDLGDPKSPAELLANFRQVDPLCPPLYFLLLNRWMTVFGTADLAVRSMSAIISILSIAVLYFGTRKLLGPRAALFTLLLQAVSPFDITYAQEARMYGLVTLTASLSGLSMVFLINAVKNASSLKTRLAYTLAYGISTWALINTHYTGLYVVLFQGLFGTAYSIKERNLKLLLHLAAGWALTCLLWLPWFDLFRQSASKRGNFYVTRDGGILWSFKGLFKLFLNWISFMAGGRIVAYAAPIYATAAALLGACAYSMFRKRGETVSPERNSTMLYIWCWALVPALIALASDIAESRKTIEVTRYLMGTAPAVFILAGCGAKYLLETGVRLRWIVVAHVFFALMNYTYAHIVEQREPWRQMAEVIEQKVEPNDLLLVSPHYDLICLNRYFTKPRMQVGTGPLLGNEQVYAVLKDRPQFWLLTAQQGSSVTVFIPPTYKQKDSIKMSHGLELTFWQN